MCESEKIKVAIQSVIKEMMDNVMNKVLYSDPFVKENFHSKQTVVCRPCP